MSKAIITEQHLHDIADAIISKGGATAAMTPAQMPAAIQAIPSGSDEDKAPEKDVIFLGSKGEILYSYTIEEAHSLTELPPIPTVKGLKSQGWTHTLQEVNEAYGQLDVGSLWVTDNDTNRMTVLIPESCLSIQIYLGQSVANGCVISWGDGQSTTMDSTTGKWYVHTYSTGGYFDIEVKANSGSLSFAYLYESSFIEPAYYSGRLGLNNFLKGIVFADKNVTINSRIFFGLTTPINVFIPTNITGAPGYFGADNLNCIVCHRNFIVPADSFAGTKRVVCWGTASWMLRYPRVQRFSFNGSPTYIDVYSFDTHYCYKLFFPPSILSIGCCRGPVCTLYDFTRHTEVPALTSTNFTGYGDYSIVVPDALYDEWIEATNWSSPAIVSHIVKASEYNGG